MPLNGVASLPGDRSPGLLLVRSVLAEREGCSLGAVDEPREGRSLCRAEHPGPARARMTPRAGSLAPLAGCLLGSPGR